MAGGKRIHVDRVEWLIMPDGSTAAGALQTGEVDWLETPVPDLVPVLERAQASGPASPTTSALCPASG